MAGKAGAAGVAGAAGGAGATGAGRLAGIAVAGTTGGVAGLAGAVAGGPVGLAVAGGKAAIDKAADVMAGGVKQVRAGFEEAGKAARQLASKDAMGLFEGHVERSAKMMEKVGPAGKVLAEGVRAAAVPVQEFTKTVEAFVQRGQQLAAYDSRLAAANAQADVKRVMSDIKEAEAMGESLGRLTDAQSDIQSDMREILMPIKKLLSEVLAAVAEKLAFLVDLAKDIGVPAIEKIADGIRHLIDLAEGALKLMPGNAGELLVKYLKAEMARRDEDDDEDSLLLDQFLGVAESIPSPATPNEGDIQAGQRLGVPLLSGA